MKRRSLLKALGILGAAGWTMGPGGIIAPASAAGISKKKLLNARALVLGQIDFVKPAKLPQIINIFLYGGPSELGANLSNMDEINSVSQNKYSNNLMPEMSGSEVTPNLFWLNAGGRQMERMMKAGRLSVYRTLNRVLDDSKAHRPSIFSNLTGLVGEEDMRPGIGSNVAAILSANDAISLDALFPFVSMEGDSLFFNQGDLSLDPRFKPLSLDRNLGNPYQRANNDAFNPDEHERLDLLAQQTISGQTERYTKVIEAFKKRGEMSSFIEELSTQVRTSALPDDPDNPGTTLVYPDNNQFSRKLENAIRLLVSNPDTLALSMGSDGLGGWDDHNDAIQEYSARMRDLFSALEVAAKHIEASGKNNIAIFVHGDFGRNANLNNSLGWDHGNNQNLYIVGAGPSAGTGIPTQNLGRLVGKTKLKGSADNNRLYTTPADDSYQCEPFAMAATMYRYFGINNPEVLTGGIAPIDQTGTTNEWVDPGDVSTL
ncbi:MAG: DUF1501 domain-containing protein [Gammaproteobacteria bacterium]|nr:DUF1501 domain-containing protein [Gammaproteobacteria bacterium]